MRGRPVDRVFLRLSAVLDVLDGLAARGCASGLDPRPRRGAAARRAIERRPGVADLGTPAARELPDLLRSVVYLESAPRGAFESSDGGHAVMDQRNETFVPHVLAITTGTTVDFPNSDKFYHNVFSLSKTAPFDLGRYAAGRSQAGTVRPCRASSACSATSIRT